ncbi:hypothetical protein LC593_29545 [Nostoc sp. CHAB 5844]|nr:hypothetical protein [Nostoc sp. CHAB 5844]
MQFNFLISPCNSPSKDQGAFKQKSLKKLGLDSATPVATTRRHFLQVGKAAQRSALEIRATALKKQES